MREIHQCTCATCQSDPESAEGRQHHRINLLMSRLDEQQRRWFAAVEATQRGHGGIGQVSQITGLDEKTITRGRDELECDLADRPTQRIRLPGGGRPPVGEKNRAGPA